MVSFLQKKIFCRNLNEAISLAEIDVTLKVMSISTNEIALFRFPPKIFLKACVRYFSPNDSPSKTMKNVFYFI